MATMTKMFPDEGKRKTMADMLNGRVIRELLANKLIDETQINEFAPIVHGAVTGWLENVASITGPATLHRISEADAERAAAANK